MTTELRLTVRRIDGRFRVVATDPEWLATPDGRLDRNPDPIMEHTHEHPFTDRGEAWSFLRPRRPGGPPASSLTASAGDRGRGPARAPGESRRPGARPRGGR